MTQDVLENLEDVLAYKGNDFDKIRYWLVAQIDYLLSHNMDRLKWVLYRIDIDEQKLKTLLMFQADKPTAEVIADEIIHRQLQKHESRKSSEAADWSFDV